MSLYDCFTYNNEDLLLDIRLNHLNDKVKKFVISESKYTHQGREKKTLFNINNFSKFKHKIIYLLIENFPPSFSNWERENYQRNYLTNAFSHIQDDDHIMISDLDEIPNLENLHNFINNKFVVFEQNNYSYKFNLLNISYPKWYGTRLCKKKFLTSPQWLRNQKIKKYSFFKFYKIKWNIVKNGGWHFSYLMTPEQIKNKIESFGHAEFNKDIFKDIKTIEEKIKNGLDLFNRDQKYNKVIIDQSFPSIIRNNKDLYEDWIH